jgi:membrane protease YdiL (CAAX protease family)
VILAFLRWARWDIMWRDPERLPLPRLAKAIIALFVLTVLIRLAGLQWADVPGELLLAILATGVMVGLAEELLFRGIVLRCLRTDQRPEFSAALWTLVGFGLFHLPNVFLGTGAAGLAQIVLAALSGYALYLFRRVRGVIWMAMLAHGSWDISIFLSSNYGRDGANALAFVLNNALVVACIVALVRSRHQDRTFTVTPEGVAPISS